MKIPTNTLGDRNGHLPKIGESKPQRRGQRGTHHSQHVSFWTIIKIRKLCNPLTISKWHLKLEITREPVEKRNEKKEKRKKKKRKKTLWIVSVTFFPSKKAPENSKTPPTRKACLKVKAPDPTEVAKPVCPSHEEEGKQRNKEGKRRERKGQREKRERREKGERKERERREKGYY